jgi:hypothetical protein
MGLGGVADEKRKVCLPASLLVPVAVLVGDAWPWWAGLEGMKVLCCVL